MKKSLQVTINELASKIDHLSSSNSDLQMEINNVSEATDHDIATQNNTSPSSSSYATVNILNKLADREQRCKILLFTILKYHLIVKQIN